MTKTRLTGCGRRSPRQTAPTMISPIKPRNIWTISAKTTATEAVRTAELKSFGYDPAQIEAQPFSGESLFGDPVQGRNIVLTIPGRRDDRQIIVGAHYDGTGIGDNGSGVALLLVERADAAD